MEHISFYLKKFSSIGFDQKNTKDSVIKAVEETTGIILKKEEIKILKNRIIVNKNGVEKTEIFLKKEFINKKFLEILSKEHPELSNKNNKIY